MNFKNKPKRLFCCFVVWTTAVVLPFGLCAEDFSSEDRAQKLCAACHSSDGNSVVSTWPKIAGQHAAYLEKQLMDYRAGKRQNLQMQPIAAALTEEEVVLLSQFFSARAVQIGTVSSRFLNKGAALYQAGNAGTGLAACSACHGPKGEGNPASAYPALRGQHADYTARQLKDFRAGIRNNDPLNTMQQIARKMSDQDIEAVANYIQGLH